MEEGRNPFLGEPGSSKLVLLGKLRHEGRGERTVIIARVWGPRTTVYIFPPLPITYVTRGLLALLGFRGAVVQHLSEGCGKGYRGDPR